MDAESHLTTVWINSKQCSVQQWMHDFMAQQTDGGLTQDPLSGDLMEKQM